MENNEDIHPIKKSENNRVQRDKKNNNKIVGIVILVVSLLLLGFAGYKLFIEKPETDKSKQNDTFVPGNPTPSNPQLENKNAITKLEGYQLSDTNKQFTVGVKTINIKVISTNDGLNGDLYIDDKKITTYEYSDLEVYLANKFIIIVWGGSQCGELILGYINEAGEYLDEPAGIVIEGLRNQDGELVIENDSLIYFYLESGKLFGSVSYSNEYDLCAYTKKTEFAYNDKKIEMKEADK